MASPTMRDTSRPDAARALPQGLIVDLVTPLHPDLSLDEAGLGRLVDRVIPQADGILAGSPGVGEALELPAATRRRLLAAALTAVGGRAPLFLGITGHSLAETRSFPGLGRAGQKADNSLA